ncbi:Deoxycytidine monophosphate (dCMP) deaminase [Arthrobotrys musiformis]|uniref:Deoxycytidylate deaminase n=1 Tax=Arthrobotrys musiformis TaxID=47236 RepID=A0AAV9WA10_9PEZI
MFIGLCGTICAGKHTVAKFLVETYGFQVLRLAAPTTAIPEDGADTVVTSFPENGDLTFPTVEELLEYVTERWQERFVTTDVLNEEMLDTLLKRPFFLLVSVDAPIVVRWKRYIEKCKTYTPPLPTPSLETFVEKADKHMFDPTTGLIPLFVRATLHLLNPSTSIDTFHENLKSINLVDETRLRPTWDAYFMQLANLAAQRSNCMKRRVGCVLVREKRVISTGYNGTPRGLTNCNNGGCVRCNSASAGGSGLSTCLCLHAEENALLEAGRERIGKGSILYCDTCPCLTCSVKIAQVGISEVVYSQAYSMDNKTADVLSEGGVKLRQFSPPREGIVLHGQSSDTYAGNKLM